MKSREYKADFVVKFLDTKRNRTREVIQSVIVNAASNQTLFAYYTAALQATENKAKEGEMVVRVSLKGYS